ncbi:unnamed protein product, partial [Rangifer tarandus platyrhynchus]
MPGTGGVTGGVTARACSGSSLRPPLCSLASRALSGTESGPPVWEEKLPDLLLSCGVKQ